MTREEMMDKVIHTFGFESPTTIKFCRIASDVTISEKEIEIYFSELMNGIV